VDPSDALDRISSVRAMSSSMREVWISMIWTNPAMPSLRGIYDDGAPTLLRCAAEHKTSGPGAARDSGSRRAGHSFSRWLLSGTDARRHLSSDTCCGQG
jgi:hypothetical protein